MCCWMFKPWKSLCRNYGWVNFFVIDLTFWVIDLWIWMCLSSSNCYCHNIKFTNDIFADVLTNTKCNRECIGSSELCGTYNRIRFLQMNCKFNFFKIYFKIDKNFNMYFLNRHSFQYKLYSQFKKTRRLAFLWYNCN